MTNSREKSSSECGVKTSGPLVKRITGVLYPSDDESLFQWVLDELKMLWCEPRNGELDNVLVSDPVPFDKTNYYYAIAPHLTRRFLCFPGLIDAGGLPDWKNQARSIETRSAEFKTGRAKRASLERKNSELPSHVHDDPRAVNIDPGYIDGARLILASTKDHAHRVWLRDEIYAEVTMRFRFGRWTSFDYTFPDFKSGVYDEFLSHVRDLWLCERHN